MKLTRRDFLYLSSAFLITHSTLATALVKSERQHFKLVLQPQSEALLSDKPPVQTWGFETNILRMRQGEPITIEVINHLPEPTSVHWHGLRINNAMDGVSGLTQKPIEPGQSFVYQYTPQDAGSFWAHSHHKTYEQLARGLYVPLIVEESEPYPVDLDLALTLDDWRIDETGQIHTQSFGSMHDWSHGGRLGNVLTVNRRLQPALKVNAGARARLRLINTSNARIMQIGLPNIPRWLLAKDGQPLPAPVPLNHPLILAPAERYDVLVDIPDIMSNRLAIRNLAGDEFVDLAYLEVNAESSISANHPAPMALPANNLPSLAGLAPKHQLTLDMSGGAMGRLSDAVYEGKMLSRKELIAQRQVWTFNGMANMPEKPLLEAKAGDLVEIEIQNNTRWPHSVHLHGHHFQSDSERYEPQTWHDSIVMASGEKIKIRFIADNPGDWLLHCHMIEHQAAGMVTWFKVVV